MALLEKLPPPRLTINTVLSVSSEEPKKLDQNHSVELERLPLLLIELSAGDEMPLGRSRVLVPLAEELGVPC